jgi:DNA polymerase III delta prime subunit
MEFINEGDYKIMSWADKYKPKTAKEVIGHKKNINEIMEWLIEFEQEKKILKEVTEVKKKLDEITKTGDKIKIKEITEKFNELDKRNIPPSCLIMTGDHGVGKTCTLHAILTDQEYTIQTINFNKIKSTKNIKDIIDRLKLTMNTVDVYSMLMENNNQKMAIVIDDLETLTTRTENNCISELIKYNEDNWVYPLIFIANNKHNKFITEIKKKAKTLKFWPPFPQEIEKLMTKIIKEEKINIKDVKIYKIIFNHSQNDIRRLIFVLQDIKTEFGDKIITNAVIQKYCETSKTKDIDFDLFKATDALLKTYTNIEDSLRIHEIDKVALPLMIHENYQNYINTTNFGSHDNNKIISDISRYLSCADTIENYMYGYQNWSIHDVQGLYGCVIPSYLINSKCPKSEMSIDLKYTIDPNKTSIKKINKKNIINVNRFLKNMDINDCIYINQIMRHLLEQGEIDKCVHLFNGYGLNLTNIETLLKVDKIKASKTNLTSTQKNQITKSINRQNNIEVIEKPKSKSKTKTKT